MLYVVCVRRADGTGAGLTAGDDTVVGGPKTPQQIAAQKRLQQSQAQVDEVCKREREKNMLKITNMLKTTVNIGCHVLVPARSTCGRQMVFFSPRLFKLLDVNTRI